jgi:hypothetical protein
VSCLSKVTFHSIKSWAILNNYSKSDFKSFVRTAVCGRRPKYQLTWHGVDASPRAQIMELASMAGNEPLCASKFASHSASDMIFKSSVWSVLGADPPVTVLPHPVTVASLPEAKD